VIQIDPLVGPSVVPSTMLSCRAGRYPFLRHGTVWALMFVHRAGESDARGKAAAAAL
jgi:hypothetical protein